jgi:hypothetical protein
VAEGRDSARFLSWLSLVWMGAEGAIAIVAGILAGSIALIGFGIDSAIEGFASLVIVWRFTGSRLLSEKAETRAQKLVAVQFFLLAAAGRRYTSSSRVNSLRRAGSGSASSQRASSACRSSGSPSIASRIGSARWRRGARERKTCSAPTWPRPCSSVCSATPSLFWWLDPAAIVIAVVAVKEGVESWRGEGCCEA